MAFWWISPLNTIRIPYFVDTCALLTRFDEVACTSLSPRLHYILWWVTTLQLRRVRPLFTSFQSHYRKKKLKLLRLCKANAIDNNCVALFLIELISVVFFFGGMKCNRWIIEFGEKNGIKADRSDRHIATPYWSMESCFIDLNVICLLRTNDPIVSSTMAFRFCSPKWKSITTSQQIGGVSECLTSHRM